MVKDRDESIRERILVNLGCRGIQIMGNIDRGVKIFLILEEASGVGKAYGAYRFSIITTDSKLRN